MFTRGQLQWLMALLMLLVMVHKRSYIIAKSDGGAAFFPNITCKLIHHQYFDAPPETQSRRDAHLQWDTLVAQSIGEPLPAVAGQPKILLLLLFIVVVVVFYKQQHLFVPNRPGGAAGFASGKSGACCKCRVDCDLVVQTRAVLQSRSRRHVARRSRAFHATPVSRCQLRNHQQQQQQ